jgi:hypothetical protein
MEDEAADMEESLLVPDVCDFPDRNMPATAQEAIVPRMRNTWMAQAIRVPSFIPYFLRFRNEKKPFRFLSEEVEEASSEDGVMAEGVDAFSGAAAEGGAARSAGWRSGRASVEFPFSSACSFTKSSLKPISPRFKGKGPA